MDNLATRAVPLLKLLLLAGIAYTIATTAWYFLSGPAPGGTVANVLNVATGETSKPTIGWQDIARTDLFGKLSAAPVATAAKPVQRRQEVAKETRLPLTLLGVFQADNADDSAAIVSQKGKPGVRYAIGQTMPGNAELVEVYGDHIILRRAGVRETLRFPKDSNLITATPQQAQASSSVRSSARITPPVRPPRSSQSNAPATAREAVETYRERMAADPQGTLKELGVSAVSADSADGYRLGTMANSPYLRNTGLQAGDVLLSVNGEPVGNASSDQAKVGSMLAQGTARLEIQRGERRFFVTASLK